MKCFRALSCLTFLILACSTAARIVTAQADEPLRPLPTDLTFNRQTLWLGRTLFRDTRLSKDNTIACVSCHSFARGGADSRAFSIGVGGAKGVVNTPTVFNSSFNFRQQWSGGAATIEEQVGDVVNSRQELSSSWPQVVAKLSNDPNMVGKFKEAYPSGINAATIADALATYVRSLTTPSRFDRYLRGEVTAISRDEKLGYERFKDYGCVGCHQGVNVGGNMFERFGAMEDYFKVRVAAGSRITKADRGRYNVTKRNEDMFVFKVPSLRNVELTAPYFHDASARTLGDAVDVMFRFQLGRTAPGRDKVLIIKFLKSLTGTLKEVN